MDYKITKTKFGETPDYELPKPLFYEELGEEGLVKLFNDFYDLLVESDISNFSLKMKRNWQKLKLIMLSFL